MDDQSLQRRSIRLKEYDYTQPGAYFVTVVAWKRKEVFGEIVDGEMQVNSLGRIVEFTWNAQPAHFSVQLDAFVIMPNHIHGILWLGQDTSEIGVGAKHSDGARVYKKMHAFPNASPLPGRQDLRTAETGSSSERPIGTVPGSLGAVIQNSNRYRPAKSMPFEKLPVEWSGSAIITNISSGTKKN